MREENLGIREVDSEENGRSRPSVRELEVLHAVITTRKTTAAAQRLGVSQPAVSRALAALESRLGRELFVRDGGRLVPTADAFALDAEATPIFDALARLENWPNGMQSGSLLRMAAPPTMAVSFLAPRVVRFLAMEPEVRIHVEVARSSDVIDHLSDGSCDLGVVDTPVAHAGIRAEVFRMEYGQCLMPVDHRLAQKDVITPADLYDEPLVSLTRRFSSRALVDRAFADFGVEPRIVMEAAATGFIVEMVRARVGVAVINPFPILEMDLPDLIFKPFEPQITFETSFLLPASGSNLPVARRFVDFVRQEQMEAQYANIASSYVPQPDYAQGYPQDYPGGEVAADPAADPYRS